ncbi:MAG: NADH-quinone oxidoreductase subunit NuoK [Deltaproteobacteria bacterium]|nr:NADH-quinone oxidoreductase subunit NuoK [Deltaproteobacteria bacterium]
MPDILAGLGLAPGIVHWMVLTAALFAVGLYGILTRRSAVGVLMAVELLLNSAALSFVVFNHFRMPALVDGQVMAVFVIAVAAAEVVVGMAVFVALYRVSHTVDLNRLDRLKNDEVKP